jgi:GTPase SAR1 family protein
MIKSLYSKLALVLLGLFFLIGIAFIVISVISTEKYQQEVNQKLNRELARLIVAEKIILQDNRINHKALKEIFHMLMVINPSIEVYLLDRGGKILAYSADPEKVVRKEVRQPQCQFLVTIREAWKGKRSLQQHRSNQRKGSKGIFM